MIESGSLTPGVSAAGWGLPAFTTLRYEAPAPALRRFINDYHVFDSDGVIHDGVVNWALPSWPVIRFVLAPEPISLRLGARSYDPLPTAALYGTTSRAMQMTSHGGVTVGVGISPLGWARLFTQPADRFRDQVVPLSQLLPQAAIDTLLARLRTCDIAREAKGILDDFFAPRLAVAHEKEEAIVALARMIADEQTHDIATVSQRIGMNPTALRRLSTRYFGFPPKLLLVRSRFMRSLVRMLMADREPDYSLIAPTYFDKPHFLRDADRFLGMTPRRFMRIDNAYLLATLRARADVLRAARRQDG